MGVLTISGGLFIAIVFALINLQIQVRLMSGLWARGCSLKQFLDIYNLGEKYNKWMTVDMVANASIVLLTSFIISSASWLSFLNPLWVGFIGVELLAVINTPIRFIGAKFAVRTNPNLLDFNGKYKGTHTEYKKLILLLDENRLNTYKNSASRLWNELLLLNKRRKEAYVSKQKLEDIKNDVQKLITAYSLENDVEKRLKAQARFNKIIKQQAEIDDFISHVEDQIMKSENVFMDIRTKLAVGQKSDSILPDLSTYTNQVKSLELTVDAMDGGDEYIKPGKSAKTVVKKR